MAEQDIKHEDFTEDNYQEGTYLDRPWKVENGGEAGGSGEAGRSQDSGASDPPDRTLFVGGLGTETTEEELKEYFTTYGTIKTINVKTDASTGKSRGFAFLIFDSAETIDKIIAVPEHTINGKKVDPKTAKARHGKILVCGLPPELPDDEIKDYFSQYGTIIEIDMPFDKENDRRIGFCYITFEQKTVETDLLRIHKRTINGHRVFVKKATMKRHEMMMEGIGIWGQGGWKAVPQGGGGRKRGKGKRRQGGWNQGGRQEYSGGKSHRDRPSGHQPY